MSVVGDLPPGNVLIPSQVYALGVQRGEWQDDAAQRLILRELDRIHDGLLDTTASGWRDRLAFWKQPEPVRGLYL